jgi:hypothetical protein
MKTRNITLILALAAVTAAVACSKESHRPIAQSSTAHTQAATVRPAAMVTVAPAAVDAPVVTASKPAVKAPASKLLTFRSRDYGVSFVYPWQYAFVSAKAIAGDESLLPKDDGSNGQFTLARVEVPRGYYPDTDFERGYFILSLNQDLDEQGCIASLGVAKEADLNRENINGVEYRWIESESGGHGSAVRQRNYAAFTNGTCYELEMSVKTSNQDGMAREIDPVQVMRRLDAILRTVNIAPELKDVASSQQAAAAAVPQQ